MASDSIDEIWKSIPNMKASLMALVALIMNWWWARMRRIDLEILWPTCKREARDLDHAKSAFAYHAYNDRAWLCLGEDALFAAIDELR
jgi:hypothetical protein